MNKKVLLVMASMAEGLAEGAVIFPNMLLVGLVYKHYGIYSFLLPFVLLYSFEKAGLFALQGFGKISNPYRILKYGLWLAFAGSLCLIFGSFCSILWCIGSTLVGIGLSIYTPLFRTVRDQLKKIHCWYSSLSLYLGYVIFGLFIVLIVLFRHNRIGIVFTCFSIYIGVILFFVYCLQADYIYHNSKSFTKSRKTIGNFIVSLLILVVLFLARIYKQTSSPYYFFAMLVGFLLFPVASRVMRKYSYKVHSVHTVWYGAIRNFLAIFSLFYFVAIGKPTTVLVAYSMIGVGVCISKIVNKPLKRLTAQYDYETVCILLCSACLLLMLIPWTPFYMIGIVLSCTFTSCGSSHAIQMYLDDPSFHKNDARLIRAKFYGIGGISQQIIMMIILYAVTVISGLSGEKSLSAYTYYIGNDTFSAIYWFARLGCILVLILTGLGTILYARHYKDT